MKILLKTIILILCFCFSAQAQRLIEPTPEDIEMAKSFRIKYPKQDVVILDSKEEITFELNKKEGKVVVNNTVKEKLMGINSRAEIQKYEFYNGQSEVKDMTLKYRNEKSIYSQINDNYYQDKDLFYNDARVKFMNVTFETQGKSYIYEVEKMFKDIKYFTSIYFNDSYPIKNKEVIITVPNWLNLELKEFNFAGFNIVKNVAEDKRKENTIYTYKIDNLDNFSDEKEAPGKSFTYPHILFIAKSFTNKDVKTPLFAITADVYKWYKSLVNDMKDDTNVLKDKVKELTEKAKTDEEKIKNIYYWVQDNIRYIAFEDGIAGFKPDESNNVFTKRYGDCKGMGNLTKQMLKLAGFDARLTWLGTKHIAYDYTTPSICVDNHMICTLFYKGKKYYLDGTEKYNSFGEYAERIQNKEVLIEDGDKFIIDKIPAVNAEANKEIYKADFVIENEKLKGICNRNASGEARASFLQIFNSFETNKKGETLEKYLASQDKNIEVTNIKTSDLKNRDLKLNIDYDISINNKVSSFDNEIYIELENRNEYRNFELKERKNDYEFEYKNNYESNISLSIPNGYKISKMPENLEIKEDNFNISVIFKQVGSKIIYNKQFIIKNAVIKANEIEKWNESIKKLNSVYNQQITLSKA